MAPRRVTLRDVAEKTGYAINTVSKALRDAPDLAASTKIRIRSAADEMGYIVNSSANSLRLGKTRTIALIVADITNPLFAIFAKEIEAVARTEGYTVFVMNTDEHPVREDEAVRAAIEKGADGVLLFQTQRESGALSRLKGAGVPYVLLCRAEDDPMADAVMIDEYGGGRLAARRLLQRGRQNIAMINAPAFLSGARLRQQGFEGALAEAGQSCRVAYVNSALGQCEDAVNALFSAREKPDGLFCFSDMMAFDAIDLLRGRRLSVPEDVSVIGFDNIQSKLRIPYPLTTVSIHKSRLARAAIKLMLRRISGDYEGFPNREVLTLQLVERASV